VLANVPKSSPVIAPTVGVCTSNRPKDPANRAEVVIIGKSNERGDNEGMLDASVEGQALDISFNIKYLIEVLNVIDEERVVFQSNGAENPGVIRPENREDFIHVIMPMSR
jgi:DNA polymerase-3 subunit beta